MSNHRTVNLLALSLSFTALSACLEDEDTEDTSPRGGLLSCPKCQLNAAQVSGHPISYLDLSGAPNEQGISIGLVQDPEGSTYDFGVYEEELAAFHDGVLVASGEKMIGWTIMLDLAGKTKSIKVKGRETLASWASNGAPISIYALEDEDETNVCPAYKTGVASLTIIHGETYDAEHAVIDHQGPEWITLACADEAVFKVKRFGYGPNGNQGKGGTPASTEQRTAAIKMVIADYCGKGHSFTAPQTQVMWRNATWTVSTADKGQLVMPEAVWTAEGAVCIGRPRYAVLAEIAKYCSLPRCSKYMANNPGPYAWQSLVPWVPLASW
jgi:hypothetical protein